MEEIKRRLDIGYTMSVYGSRDNIHKQMENDIKELIEINERLKNQQI